MSGCCAQVPLKGIYAKCDTANAEVDDLVGLLQTHMYDGADDSVGGRIWKNLPRFMEGDDAAVAAAVAVGGSLEGITLIDGTPVATYAQLLQWVEEKCAVSETYLADLC